MTNRTDSSIYMTESKKTEPKIWDVGPNRKKPNRKYLLFDQTEENRTDKNLDRMALVAIGCLVNFEVKNYCSFRFKYIEGCK